VTGPGTRFQERRLGAEQRARLLAAVSASRLATAAAVTLVHRWRDSIPANVTVLRDWLPANLGRDSAPERLLVSAVRDGFLAEVDGRLQELYRDFYRANEPDATATHEERIQALVAVRPLAAAVVAEYDWAWLGRWLWPGDPARGMVRCLTRLSNFAFPIKRVNFRFTYHCNISCRHCYNNSGPEARLRLPTAAMIGIIGQMPAAGIDALNLTGGEPMLYQREVGELIQAARSAGLREVSIFTNGFWATTAERTDRVLEELVHAGFMREPADHLKVSAGAYHQEFLPFDRVLTLAERYGHFFQKKLTIDYEVIAGAPDPLAAPRAALHARGLLGRVHLLERTVQPLGRGRALEVESAGPLAEPCDSINQIVFDPDGAVRPCCGMNADNKGVVIGTLGETSLRELMKRMQNDGLLQVIATRPMDQLSALVSPGDSEHLFTGPCHSCQHAIGGLVDKEAVWRACFSRQAYYPFWFESPDHGRTIDARFDVGSRPVAQLQ